MPLSLRGVRHSVRAAVLSVVPEPGAPGPARHGRRGSVPSGRVRRLRSANVLTGQFRRLDSNQDKQDPKSCGLPITLRRTAVPAGTAGRGRATTIPSDWPEFPAQPGQYPASARTRPAHPKPGDSRSWRAAFGRRAHGWGGSPLSASLSVALLPMASSCLISRRDLPARRSAIACSRNSAKLSLAGYSNNSSTR